MNLILLASIVIIYLLFLIRGRRAISKKVAHIPSPPRLPFIGNLHQLGSILHLSLYKLSKQHGPLMLLHFCNKRTLVVSSPKVAEELIRNNDFAFASRPLNKLLNVLSTNQCGVGFTQYGETWRQMRKLCMTYLLSSNRVKSLSFHLTDEVSLFLKKIANEASRGNGVICLTEMLNSYVTSVISKLVLGPWVSEEKKKRFSKLAHETLALLSLLFIEDYFPRLKWLDVLRGCDGRLKNHGKNWNAILEEVLNDHSKNSKEANGKNSTYFIDSLLELKNNSSIGFVVTRHHVKALLQDILTAGVDTSSVALDWCMTELIRNPGVMKKLKEEIRGNAKGADMIREEQLGQMTYLKAFIKEVFRLHPPSPLLVPRESFKDCQILGYNIPKQTTLLLNAWAFGRDERYWEAPEQFMPERFLDGTVDYIDKDFTFIPFGFGRRICPGMHLAKVVIELALANLLYRFDWSLPNGITIEDMDMDDDGQIVSARKQKLELVPIASKVN